MSVSGALASLAEPQRRQNSSCDPCRRSKRRCFFSSPSSTNIGTSCVHCTRLGHNCTFNFASSRLSSRPKNRQRQNDSESDQLSVHTEQTSFENSLEILGRTTSNSAVPSVAETQEDFAAWLNFDIEDYLAGDFHLSEQSPQEKEQIRYPETDRRVSLLPNRSQGVRRPFSQRREFLPGTFADSPIHLLNSKLDASILEERLISIYETISTGSAARFLDYDTNLYATGIRYQIETYSHETYNTPTPATESSTSDQHENSPPSSLGGNLVQMQAGITESSERHMHEGCSMTILGCVRFLDHFGGLYGNRLNRSSKRKSDKAFKAALRVFALQWLPIIAGSEESCWTPPSDLSVAKDCNNKESQNPSNKFYTHAWHQARMAIEDAKSTLSFRAVFAAFIFDGTAIPMDARNASREPEMEHEFLSISLQKLHQLDSLVQNYSTTLGPSSQYGTLTEASLTLVRWSAYIRDTGAALISDYQCRLADPFQAPRAFPRNTSVPPTLFLEDVEECDRKVPEICRGLAAEAFYIWRQIADVKNDLLRACNNSYSLNPELLEKIRSVVNLIENFNKKLLPFIEHCIRGFCKLSMPSRVSCVSLVVPWDMGILVLAESLGPFINYMDNEASQNIGQPMQVYQRNAAFSVAQIARCTLDLPAEEAFNLQNGLASEAPITAYHITPRIITTAIEKAVVYYAQLCGRHDPNPFIGSEIAKLNTRSDTESESPEDDVVWRCQIDFLMKALLSLEVTIGGSQEVGQVLKFLLQEFGDIISESWSCDFDT